MEIRISQTFGKLGIHIVPSTLQLNQNLLPLALVKVSMGELKIEQRTSEVRVDWSQAQAEMGLKNLTYTRQEAVSMANANAVQAIQGYVAEGDFYATVPSTGNHFAQWETNRGRQQNIDLTVAAIPSVGSLAVDFTKPSLLMDINDYQVSVNPNIEPVQVQASRAKVDIYEMQKYEVRVSAVKGQTVDRVV